MRNLTSSGFISTFNRLSGNVATPTPDAEQVKRMVLQRLQEGPTDLQGLAKLSLPAAAVEAAVHELQELGMIEPVPNGDAQFQLSEFAARALTYITPA